MLRLLAAGGCGLIAGMFIGCLFWFVRQPDRLMWAAVLAAGFAGGMAGAVFYRAAHDSAKGGRMGAQGRHDPGGGVRGLKLEPAELRN